jgi:uncharacterized membrane protein YjgN (DUF898 family)
VKYAFLAFGTGVLIVLTLGLAYPYYRNVLHRYRMRNTWFGDRAMGFDGRARDLFWSWFLTWLLYLPTASLIHFWYLAKETRYFVSKTSYGSLRFTSDLRGAQLFWIYIAYMLSTIVVMVVVGTIIFMLGPEILMLDQLVQDQAAQQGANSAAQLDTRWFAATMVAVMAFAVVVFGMLYILVFLHPVIRAVCATLSVFGDEDYAAIAQSQQATPARGEGLADALDVGAI